jgi:phosphate starvation-inducible protein PhoH
MAETLWLHCYSAIITFGIGAAGMGLTLLAAAVIQTARDTKTSTALIAASPILFVAGLIAALIA